ncbi:helix-turn-helix domain-containing protein [Microbacterium sp. gxy059]|uniref:helix-turn-helix domain-containing protein n=1 Tax=Microbacterium sp. gxy059 TaxID=2957199 RepID=UPI003D992DDA
MSVNREDLERVLASVEIRRGSGRRVAMRDAELLALAPADATLLYVLEGSVRPLEPAGGGSDAVALGRGDAFLAAGRRSLAVEAAEDAVVLVGEASLAGSADLLAATLPPALSVSGFEAREPAAATLAAAMGGEDAQAVRRSGDPLICRMMTTTVLLSIIRAWADAGCAPAGWPTLADDPFLDRVVSGIHTDPGDDWSLERLASTAAMSRSVFAERFHRALGVSPARYVARVRIEAAQRMLEEGAAVSEASRRLGYSSDEGFSRAFRRHTGMPPSAWRARAGSALAASCSAAS